MRWSGWARIDYLGDPIIAEQYVPLARLLIGQVVNRLKLAARETNDSRRQAYRDTDTTWAPVGLGSGSISRVYPDGTQIDAGFMGGIPWARITAGSSTSSGNLDGYGFILSPFNGSLPTTTSPEYASTLLLINGGAYVNDYPDSGHQWFTADNTGYYLDLGNEFTANGLLQGNLHWRSTVDTTYHLSWLGNPSDPIPYFKIDFQNGYDSGNSPYAVRLSPTTVSPAQSGSIYNFDSTQVFSVWLADMFGGLKNLQNGSGIGQVICYKGHVVKPVYDLLKPGSPITARNAIVGVGGTVDPTTQKRTLYFVVRAFQDVLPVPSNVLTETVYSLDIDNAMAGTLLIGSRTIGMTGAYNTAISVDPIPLHGYQWLEATQQFVCVAAQVNTTPFSDASHEPEFHNQNVTVRTGKLTWTVSSDGSSASYDFNTSQTIVTAPTPQYNYHGHSDFGILSSVEFGDEQYLEDSTTDVSFGYGVNNALIGVTPLNDVLTSCSYSATENDATHNSNFVLDPTQPVVKILTQEVSTKSNASFTQSVTCGAKTWNVASYSSSSSTDDTQSYTDHTESEISVSVNITESFTYNGLAFLWFDDVNKVFAHFEYQLAWTRTSTQNYGPIPVIGGIPTPPVVTFTVTSYQGRYVVESPQGSQETDWFDLTAGGRAGDGGVTSSEFSTFAFAAMPPIHVDTPTAPANIDATLLSNTVTPTVSDQVYARDYGSTLPLFELVNIVSMSLWNMPVWSVSAGFHTGVAGRIAAFTEPDGTYSFTANHPGGWAINGKRLCFSQIGPKTIDALGNTLTQSPFQFLTNGNLDTLAGATGDDRGYYPLCYIAPKEIKAQGQS